LNANLTVAFIRLYRPNTLLYSIFPSCSLSTFYGGPLFIFIASVRTFVNMILSSALHIRPNHSTFTWFVYLQYVWLSNSLYRLSFFLLSNGIHRLMLYTPGHWEKNVSQKLSFKYFLVTSFVNVLIITIILFILF